MIRAYNLTEEQLKWCRKYEDETGFEPIKQEDLNIGYITFEDFARLNIRWFENWSNNVLSMICDYPTE